MSGSGDLVTVENFINGEFCPTTKYLDSYDPSTGSVWAKIPDSTAEDVNKAVKAAQKAFPSWSSKSAEERSKWLNKIADMVENRFKEFVEAESRDQGKPLWLASAVDIPRLLHNFRYFAKYICSEVNSSVVQPEFSAVSYTVKCPIGVVGLITPWNLPLYLLSFKIAPAIAFGNTVVAKPSEMTSVSAHLFCQVIKESGLPDGVINVVFGTGPSAGKAVVEHPQVPLISFTGGTATGSVIRKATALMSKKLSLELGGKNSAIIFDDCNFDKCLETTIKSSFVNQGEVCLCTSRIFVQRGIYQKFLDAFVQKASSLKVGDPKASDTFCGALISKAHRDKVIGFIERAGKSGATINCGHGIQALDLPPSCKDGYYVRPTVITDIKDEDEAMQEEIFGPVTCIVPFDTEDEVLARANGVRYGLCATLWSENVSRVHRLSPKIEVGMVWVNCWLVRSLNMPFGGVKDSGMGREGGRYSAEMFTEEKFVCIQH